MKQDDGATRLSIVSPRPRLDAAQVVLPPQQLLYPLPQLVQRRLLCVQPPLQRAVLGACVCESLLAALHIKRFHLRRVARDARGAAEGAALTLIMLTTSPHSCSAASSTSRLLCRLRPIAMARASSRSAFSNLRAMRLGVQERGRPQSQGATRAAAHISSAAASSFSCWMEKRMTCAYCSYQPKPTTQIQ